jgi:phosphatidylglycerophosphate synthase
VLSSVGGSVVGALVGGFVEQYRALPWIFWVQLIVGGATQFVHAVYKTGEDPNVYGPNEIRKRRIALKEFGAIIGRLVLLHVKRATAC